MLKRLRLLLLSDPEPVEAISSATVLWIVLVIALPGVFTGTSPTLAVLHAHIGDGTAAIPFALVVALHWARRADDPVSVISRSMMRTLMYVAAFNAVFAYLVYGVLLFGLVNDG